MQTQHLNDNCYNTIHQLTKTLEFLARADTYVQDANNAGDDKAKQVWNTIKEDRQKHADMLKGLVTSDLDDQAHLC